MVALLERKPTDFYVFQYVVQWVPELFERLEFFHVNKSRKTECCGNKTHQIIQNMILSRGLELKLSLY